MSERRVSVVLTEPGESLNIGSVARAMSNFQFNELRLVNPPRLDLDRARITACHGSPVLDAMSMYTDLRSATSDADLVVGFSAERGKDRIAHSSFSSWLQSSALYRSQHLALVFGPEDTGLRMEHLACCSERVYIETSPGNPSLNLAAAVLLVVYELSKRKFTAEADEARAASGKYDTLCDIALAVARRSGFLDTGSPAGMPELLESLIRKPGYSDREIQILLGLFGKTLRVLDGKAPTAGTVK